MEIICGALQLFVLVIFARIVLSWFPAEPGGALATVNRLVAQATDWLFIPLQRIIPPLRMGAMMLDLTPIVVLLVVQLLLMPIVC